MSITNPYDPYDIDYGGKWFYTQNKPGYSWFDRVDNSVGWTVDFSLDVYDIENTLNLSEFPDNDGIGIYLNDGTFQESINFFTQEIILQYSGARIPYNTTGLHHYRITGQNDDIAIYGSSDGDSYEILSKSKLTKDSFNGANATRIKVVEDSNGINHVIWVDDSGGLGQLFYAYSSEEDGWSSPSVILNSSVYIDDIDVKINENDEIFVLYTLQEIGSSSLALITYKNNNWGKPEFIPIDYTNAHSPAIGVTSQNRIIVSWHDDREGRNNVYCKIKNPQTLSWGDDIHISDIESNIYGGQNPSISIFGEYAFLSWTALGEKSGRYINISKYNFLDESLSDSVTVSETTLPNSYHVDNSDMTISLSGEIYIVWHGGAYSDEEIYFAICNIDLVVTSSGSVTNNDFANKFPSVGRSIDTSDIYIVWENHDDTLNSAPRLSLAYYDAINNEWHSSSNVIDSNFDVVFTSDDLRLMYKPSISKTFMRNLNIYYLNAYANNEDRFLNNTDTFFNVNNVVYYLSNTNANYNFDNYDISLTSNVARKEIRFGDFSNVFGSYFKFGYIKYYLEGAVEPVDFKNITGPETIFNQICSYAVSVNDYGNIWAATDKGLIFYSDISDLMSVPDATKDQKIIDIAFDKNNIMFYATEDAVYASKNHLSDSTSPIDVTALLESESFVGIVNKIIFDKDNNLVIATKGNGIYICDIFITPLGEDDETTLNGYRHISSDSFDNISNDYVNTVVTDGDAIWFGTKDGLYKFYNNTIVKFNTQNGLLSNNVTDIAIVNKSFRFIATPYGVNKMAGSAIDILQDVGMGKNVYTLKYQSPNILWINASNNLYCILLDSEYNVDSYKSYNIVNAYNNKQIYGIVTDITINDDDYVEVFINGNKIYFGYKIFNGDSHYNPAIYFETPLLEDDIVSVKIRGDISLIVDKNPSDLAWKYFTNDTIRIKSLQYPYLIAEGPLPQLLEVQNISQLPTDTIILDTDPPLGKLTVAEIIDFNTVKFKIEQLKTDETCSEDGSFPLLPFDSESGIDKMIVSNYPNFTTDGTNPATPVDFKTNVIHNLNISNILMNKMGDIESVKGSVVHSGTNNLYYGTSNGASIYQYNYEDSEWNILHVFSTSVSTSVDFIQDTGGQVIVGVGDESSSATIYKASYSMDGALGSFSAIGSLSGKHCYGAYWNGTGSLYIGSSGYIYRYDGSGIELKYENIGTEIYSIVQYGTDLYVGTGDSSRIYKIDIEDNTSLIIYSGSDSVIKSIEVFSYVDADGENKQYLYAGTNSSGIILRSEISNINFYKSYQSLPVSVASLTTGQYLISDNNYEETIFAAIGKIIYRYSISSGSWEWICSHDENINKLSYSSRDSALYAISDSGIYYIENNTQSKRIYLKLIDKAGNETQLTDEGQLNCFLFTDVTISDLQSFTNYNSLIELNSSGNVINQYKENAPFYAADRVEEEIGTYYSEIFSGTNDLIKWDTISWVATEPNNTSVLIYVRVSNSSTDILTQEFVGPYTIGQSGGVDISTLSGRFIQFKAVLKSQERDLSPSLKQVVIRMISGAATHFFTTNFSLPADIQRGILTSQTIEPVASDIVFGINTEDSVDFSDYQIIDENRLFDIAKPDEQFRIGIKFITPNISSFIPEIFDEYGPYDTDLFINTLSWHFSNNTGSSDSFSFKIEFYDSHLYNNLVYTVDTSTDTDGFVYDNSDFSNPLTVGEGSTVELFYSPPSSSKLICNEYYFVKIIAYNSNYSGTILNNWSYIKGCSSAYVNEVDFSFENTTSLAKTYNFRIKFYSDPERTNLLFTKYSGNDNSEWLFDGIEYPVNGVVLNPGETTLISFIPDISETSYTNGAHYYLTIDVYDGAQFIMASEEYDLVIQLEEDIAYCSPYSGVPVLKNFGFMFELEDNQTINIYQALEGAAGQNVFLEAPDGSRYKMTIDDGGNIVSNSGSWYNDATRLVLKSTNNTYYKVDVDNNGNIYTIQQVVNYGVSYTRIVLSLENDVKYYITVNNSGTLQATLIS